MVGKNKFLFQVSDKSLLVAIQFSKVNLTVVKVNKMNKLKIKLKRTKPKKNLND